MKFFVEEGCTVPTRSDPGSAGFDICTREDHVIEAGESKLMSTGVHVEVPEGHYARVAPRSGPASRWGLSVGAGVVDYGYTGEIKVLVFNHGKAPVNIQKTNAVAQLIFERICMGEATVVGDVKELYASATNKETAKRGERGFSSSEYLAFAYPDANPAVV